MATCNLNENYILNGNLISFYFITHLPFLSFLHIMRAFAVQIFKQLALIKLTIYMYYLPYTHISLRRKMLREDNMGVQTGFECSSFFFFLAEAANFILYSFGFAEFFFSSQVSLPSLFLHFLEDCCAFILLSIYIVP